MCLRGLRKSFGGLEAFRGDRSRSRESKAMRSRTCQSPRIPILDQEYAATLLVPTLYKEATEKTGWFRPDEAEKEPTRQIKQKLGGSHNE